MLIDCHVHVNNYDETKNRSTEDIAAELFGEMEACGVRHAVVLTSYKVNPHRPHAEKVIEVLGDDPRITIVEGLRWRPDRKEERTDLFAMEERIAQGAVRGIKLYPGYDKYPINDPSLESFFRLAAKYEIPVMIHTGDTYSKHAKVRQAHPLLVDDIAVDYPDVNFIMCHLGNPWFDDAAEVLYKNDNVFADISGLTLSQFTGEFEKYMLERVREMIQYMGDPGRQLLYGSDWPLVAMKSYRKFFEGLDVSDDQREAIAWENTARLFKIDVSQLSKTGA
jgi:uncharacterized protein